MTMTVYLNDNPTVLTKPCSLETFLSEKNLQTAPVAIALNQQFVPKTHLSTTHLKEGDKIDIITPMQGG